MRTFNPLWQRQRIKKWDASTFLTCLMHFILSHILFLGANALYSENHYSATFSQKKAELAFFSCFRFIATQVDKMNWLAIHTRWFWKLNLLNSTPLQSESSYSNFIHGLLGHQRGCHGFQKRWKWSRKIINWFTLG